MELDGELFHRSRLIHSVKSTRVYLATNKQPHSNKPRLMIVKTAYFSSSASLRKEAEVFQALAGGPNILSYFGDEETTVSNDRSKMSYNVLLEYAGGGTLARLIEKSVDGLPEPEVKRYTKSIVRGIRTMHNRGYVHRDLKPQNLVLVAIPDSELKFMVKIGDLGMAERLERTLGSRFTRPIMYVAPECVIHQKQQYASDIWSLGCIVLQMLTGKMPWIMKPGCRDEDILQLIKDPLKYPAIPTGISKEAAEFLKRCFVRNPRFRFTTDMLMALPFLAGVDDGYIESESSPKMLMRFWNHEDSESDSSSGDDSSSDSSDDDDSSSDSSSDESSSSDEDSSCITGESTKRQRVSKYIVEEDSDWVWRAKPLAPLRIVDQTSLPTVVDTP